MQTLKGLSYVLMEPVEAALRGSVVLRDSKLLSVFEEEILDRIRNNKYHMKP